MALQEREYRIEPEEKKEKPEKDPITKELEEAGIEVEVWDPNRNGYPDDRNMA